MELSSSFTTGAVLIMATLASAHAARKCTDLIIEVPVVARNAVFNLTAPSNNVEVTNFVLDQIQQGHNLTNEVLTGYANIEDTYHVAATYCEPHSGPSDTIQLLTPGIGFDRTYWDITIHNYNYSYVAQAVDYGYSTFAWDRVGIAESQHGDAVNEIQSYLEIAALYSLTQMLREGSIDGIDTGFDKVVHVGHSFGSIQSYSLAVLYPGASDGLVLTGFSQTSQFISFFSLGANLVLANSLPSFKDYPDGYIASGDKSAVHTNLFAPGEFDAALLDLAFASGKPVTVGEMLSLSGATAFENPLTGPVLIITGSRDLPFCGGDCLLTGDTAIPNFLELSRPNFPATSKFKAVIVDEAGHGLNFEYSHSFTYNTILDFITQNVGL
ncbi:hypothetical protein VMCG_08276 [Cytospora schulzeri]|uniref:AB hydrolase-1 domain-containing protein n=1 Tax=Cytospora schulzeri TaxID=448051 RepID=A0A423VSL8_9PEZI|nr:hypothetical protein VMCG_08276 [Valsa malicola]